MDEQVHKVLSLASWLGLRQSDLARALGVTPQTVNNWKRRGRIPARNLFRLAEVLGVPIEQLLEAASAFSYELALLLQAYRNLSPESRAALIANAQALLKAEGHPPLPPK